MVNRVKMPPIGLLCVIYYFLAALFVPGFFSLDNGWNLLYNFAPLLILAVGQTFVMLTAGIDLSITAVIAFCSITGGFLMSADTAFIQPTYLRLLLGLLAMLTVGSCIGLINGFAVANWKMPAFIVTLTTTMIFSGLAVWLTHSSSYYNLPETFVDFPYEKWIGIPVYLAFVAVLVLVAAGFLRKTLWGQWIIATGVNSATARISAVPINKVILLVYVFSGASAALASMFYTARLETGSPVMGRHVLLDVIGAVVLGGTSLFGGKGKITWTVWGALFITLLDNSLNLFGVSYFLIMVVKGIIILITAIFNGALRKEVALA